MFDIETKLGEIHFPASTINRIVMEAVESCGDKVDILNYKGNIKYDAVAGIPHEHL